MKPRFDTFPNIDDPTHWPERTAKWSAPILLKVSIYVGLCMCLVLSVPNSIFDAKTWTITMTIGGLGIWRYGWWFTHAVRSVIYGKIVYPRMRKAGYREWANGWRPRHMHFMMTTYKEHRQITEMVVRSIVQEIVDSGVAGTIWLGSSDRYDEDIISDFLRREAADVDITLRIIRQNVSGKRAAIGLVLRAMSRLPVLDDDLVIFMDGDFVLAKGAVSRCMPLFKVYPDLQACTTDEEVICIGPRWIEMWLQMRFSQRRLAMQSHALSGRVLTLTEGCLYFVQSMSKNLNLSACWRQTIWTTGSGETSVSFPVMTKAPGSTCSEVVRACAMCLMPSVTRSK